MPCRRVLMSLGALLACLVTTPVQAADDQWKAGVASVVITPDEPMWMAGYASRKAPSDGKINDLSAKALALESKDKTRLVIVTLDLIGVPRVLADSLRRKAAQRYQLPGESLLLNASHTHCGPTLLTSLERAELWGLPKEQLPKLAKYMTQLEGKLIALIGQAIDDLKPASLSVSQSAAAFARNRRFPTDTGYVNKQYDDGPVDHDVPVLKVVGADGALRAVMFGYACHNTTLGIQQFCGDYAGFAQQHIEEKHPGATALFFMGTGGDQNPYPRGTVELCRQHGKALADSVERALAGKQTTVNGPLRVAYEDVTLEFAPLPSISELHSGTKSSNVYEKRKSEYLLKKLKENGLVNLTYDCPIQVARFGKEILLVAIGGEVVVDYSRKLKSDRPGEMVWVGGYSNDVFGYLPSLRVLKEGGYEGGGAFLYSTHPGPFTDSVEERVMGTVNRLIDATR